MIPTASASWAQLQAEKYVNVNRLDPNLTDHIATAMQIGYSNGIGTTVAADSGYSYMGTSIGLVP